MRSKVCWTWVNMLIRLFEWVFFSFSLMLEFENDFSTVSNSLIPVLTWASSVSTAVWNLIVVCFHHRVLINRTYREGSNDNEADSNALCPPLSTIARRLNGWLRKFMSAICGLISKCHLHYIQTTNNCVYLLNTLLHALEFSAALCLLIRRFYLTSNILGTIAKRVGPLLSIHPSDLIIF